MKLSIIVPIFNSEETITDCLNSILAQTFRDFEIICVNDGSTDNTKQILAGLEATDKRIKVINQTNSGVASARNKGLQNSCGEFIGFVDSDDKISPTMFEKMIHAMESEDVDLVMCGSNLIDISGKKFDANDMELINPKFKEKVHLKKQEMNSINVFLWNKLFRKQLIETHRISFPDGMWYEDSAFVWCYLTTTKFFVYIPEKLYHYHRISTSIMGQTHSKNYSRAIDHLRICRFVSNFLRKDANLRNKYFHEFLELCLSNFIGSLIYSPARYRITCFFELISILWIHGSGAFIGFCSLVIKKMANRISRVI